MNDKEEGAVELDPPGVVISTPHPLLEQQDRDGWVERNWHWIGFILVAIIVALIYFWLPHEGRPVPEVPTMVWLGLFAALGIKLAGDGRVDAALAKTPPNG